jgi:hypothetical protein
MPTTRIKQSGACARERVDPERVDPERVDPERPLSLKPWNAKSGTPRPRVRAETQHISAVSEPSLMLMAVGCSNPRYFQIPNALQAIIKTKMGMTFP